ncbi:MAG TPA: hypothetical protein VF600_03810 [Abditibacteriaceae bacterium]|jgi:hypothetical protein
MPRNGTAGKVWMAVFVFATSLFLGVRFDRVDFGLAARDMIDMQSNKETKSD